MPYDLDCSEKPSKVSTTTTTSTPKPTTTVGKPSYNGFASPLLSLTSCNKNSIVCPDNYIIVIESSVYGVKHRASDQCSYE